MLKFRNLTDDWHWLQLNMRRNLIECWTRIRPRLLRNATQKRNILLVRSQKERFTWATTCNIEKHGISNNWRFVSKRTDKFEEWIWIERKDSVMIKTQKLHSRTTFGWRWVWEDNLHCLRAWFEHKRKESCHEKRKVALISIIHHMGNQGILYWIFFPKITDRVQTAWGKRRNHHLHLMI